MAESPEKLGMIVVAAGEGRRLGGNIRKALVPVAGRPLLLHALERLAALPHLREGVVVIHPADRARVEEEWGEALRGLGVARIVDGGKEREESVRAGLEALSAEITLVAIHDAARPYVHADDLHAVVGAAIDIGAAILAEPVSDTVKIEGDPLRIAETFPRHGLWLAQTPQVFRRELLEEAHRRLDRPVTDDAEAVERLGEPVVIVPATSPNWKITTRADLEVARHLLRTLTDA